MDTQTVYFELDTTPIEPIAQLVEHRTFNP